MRSLYALAMSYEGIQDRIASALALWPDAQVARNDVGNLVILTADGERPVGYIKVMTGEVVIEP